MGCSVGHGGIPAVGAVRWCGLQPSYLPVCIKTLNEAKLDVKGTAGLQKRLQKGSFCYTSEMGKQSLMNYSSQWQSTINLRTFI